MENINHSSPHSIITTGIFGLFEPGSLGVFSIFFTTFIDSLSNTYPNTTCLLSSQSHLAQVIKN